ncbi:MAG: histidinol-phosphatase [Bacteroidia bacterium]|nr:histidinol-phosphatase [Bacteroidia bacterium]
MPWTNYHSHSHYCDGVHAPERYVAEAIEREFCAWGFSSHAPVPFACKWTMPEDRLDEYLNEVSDLKRTYEERIQLYAGLEVDFVPGITGPARLRALAPSLDYLIGSVHFVDAFADGTPWEIDGRHELFLEGLHQIFGGNIEQAIERYYALITEMVETDAPDVVGHLDKIIIQNEGGALFTGKEAWYQAAVRRTLGIIKEKDLIVEVNTRGMYKGLIKEPYPAQWMLREMAAMQIPITLSSDAHHPREINGAFPETAQMLREAGFHDLHILYDGVWQAFPFDRWGVRVGTPVHS